MKKIRSIKIFSLFLLLFFVSCIALRKKDAVKRLKHVETQPQNFCVTLKCNIVNNTIYLKARVGGTSTDQNFMFDTGAPLTYSFKTKDSFNIHSKRYFRAGSHKIDYGSGAIALGNIKFNNAGFIVADDVLEEYTIDGLVGSSLFQNSICELNFSDSTLKISNDLKNFTNIKDGYTGSFKPLEGQATPIVKIAIGKDTMDAFIDSGFDGFIKLSQRTKISSYEATKKESVSNGRYFGGPNKDHIFTRTHYRVHHFNLLGLKQDSVLLLQYPDYYGRNLVGLSFLKKFIVTIDWIHHQIYLKPIQEINFKKNIYTYGFSCTKYNNGLRVLEIYKGSDAEKAGLKSGDIIVSINNSKEFSEDLISGINANIPASDSIRVEVTAKKTVTLKKYKLFN